MLYLWRMNIRHIHTIRIALSLTLIGLTRSAAHAALPIDLEVATEPGVPLAAPQEWARRLGRMDLGTVRLRGARGGERPRVEKKSGSSRYHVLAILTGRNELLLPGQRFRVGDQARLAKYFQQLPEQTEYTSVERGRFGLTKAQFEQVYAELSQPVGFSTIGKKPIDLLRLAEQKVATPIQQTGSLSRDSTPLIAELRELSLGTALAYALRCEGLMLVPEQLPGESLRISVEPYNSKVDSWPIGWKPAISSRRSAPQLYEKRNIEIKGFTLAQALTALQPALQVPVVIDSWTLARQQIDPATEQVELPKKRTFLKSALGKLLSQARLAHELRVDEQDQAFLWITRFGKDSPTATK